MERSVSLLDKIDDDDDDNDDGKDDGVGDLGQWPWCWWA